MPATWGDITAEEILAPTNGALVSGKQQTVFSGISTDSRSTGPGELFWALVGERFDGHDFAQIALDRGAAGVVAQRDRALQISRPNAPTIIEVEDSLKAFGDLAGWWRHQHDTRVVAITGSAGKTTTKDMAAGILKIGRPTLVTQGNFNNLIGLPITLLRLEEGHRNTVLEMGMNRSGEIARLTEIADPDVGVITNVGMAHLEGLGDIKGVASAKVELVEKISPGGRVILNGDDKLLMKSAAVYRENAVTFGLGEHNDIRGTDLRNLGQEGSSFHLRYQDVSLALKLNIPGIQNVFNALAAAAACLCLHESPEHIAEGLHGFTGVKGRFTLVSLGDVSLVDDTYNANPSSLKAALESVGALVDKGGRIIVGLGEMMELGDAATTAHREAGRMVAALEPKRFLAMGEHAREMVEGALESGMHRGKAATVKTHDEMVEIIGNEMQQRDLIFLKGSRKMDLGKVVDGLRSRCH